VNLLLFEATELGADGDVTVSGARALHLTEVLKVTSGSRVRVGLVDGPVGEASVVAVTTDRVALKCAMGGRAPARPPVDLLLALPRPKVMRRLWAQLSALGVGRIILTNAERVERHYFDTHVLGEACYRPLLIEGLQQARDTRLPFVSIHRQFRKLVEDELKKINGRIFARGAFTKSWGCHTGESMSKKWLAATGVPMWGVIGKTQYMMDELPVIVGQNGVNPRWVNR